METVGVGQVEVEVAGQADTTVVVVNPGWGDAVQANKAGLMEIADVFVINKADRPGVDETRRDLELMLDLSDLGDWRPPIVTAVATDGTGIGDVWSAVEAHRESIEKAGQLQQRATAHPRGAAPDRRPAPRGPGPGAVPGHDLRRAGAHACSSAAHRPVGGGRRAARRRRRLSAGERGPGPRGSTA